MRNPRWKVHFEFTRLANDRINALCKLCGKNYKEIGGVTSNFLKHLKRLHVREYDQLFFGEQHKGSPTSSPNVEGQNGGADVSEKRKQNRLSSSIVKNLVVKCNLPLNIVENGAFRNFMKECSSKWQPISAKTIKNNFVPSFVDKVRKEIEEKLNGVSHVTLTVDAWTDRRTRSFLGVTVHYLDLNMEPHAHLIDFTRLTSPHTGQKIHQLTEEILERYNLNEKIFKIVTDNAASMIKAYRFGLTVTEDTDHGNGEQRKISENVEPMEDYEGEYSCLKTKNICSMKPIDSGWFFSHYLFHSSVIIDRFHFRRF